MNRARKNKKGLTVVEIVLGLIILAIGLLPILTMMIRTSYGIEGRENTLEAISHANVLLEGIKAKKWDENSPSIYEYAGTRTAQGSLGPDSGETTLTSFDDVDDFNGYSDTILSEIDRTISVNYVNVTPGSDITPAGAGVTTDYKQVAVTVSWRDGRVEDQVVSAIIINGL